MIDTKRILSVMMALLIVSSGFVGAMGGTVSAQTSEDSVVTKCADNVDIWGVITPVYGVYQCIDGAYTPADYDSSSELENESWNNAISIQDAVETREKEYNNWDETAVNSSVQRAEEPLIEAHYAEEDEGQARSNAQEQIRQFYSAQYSQEYAQHNDVIERAYSISKNTNADTDTNTIIQFEFNADVDETVSVGSNSELKYETVTMPNGEEMEVVREIRGDLGSDYGTTDAVTPTIVFLTNDSGVNPSTNWQSGAAGGQPSFALLGYDSTNDEYVQLDQEYLGMEMTAVDPYGGENRTIRWNDTMDQRLQSINSNYNTAQSEVETMASDLYATHEPGTINPNKYLSAYSLTQQYAQEDSHYSYAAAKATTVGYQTDLTSQQILSVNGTEYEGMILTSGSGSQFVDGDITTVSDRSSPVLEFNDEGEDTIKFNQSIDAVDGLTEENYSISNNSELTVQESAVDDYILVNSGGGTHTETFSSVTQGDILELSRSDITFESATDGSGNDITMDIVQNDGSSVEYSGTSDQSEVTIEYTTTSSTSVAYEDSTAKESGVPSGIEIGKQYTASDFSGTVMVSYQTGDTAEVMTLESTDNITLKEATDSETGENRQIGVIYDDGQQRTFTDTSNLTEELERVEDIQTAMEQREDVDPAGSGGGDVGDRLQDFGAGVLFAGAIGLLLVVLALIGKITSVA